MVESRVNRILQACPFCGSSSISLFGEPINRGEETFGEAMCLTCSAHGPTVWGKEEEEGDLYQIALQIWNIRGGPTELLSPKRRGSLVKVRAASIEDHKACPWCGSKQLFVDDQDDKIVTCDNCDASGPWDNMTVKDPYKRLDAEIDEGTAWKLWDSRPISLGGSLPTKSHPRRRLRIRAH